MTESEVVEWLRTRDRGFARFVYRYGIFVIGPACLLFLILHFVANAIDAVPDDFRQMPLSLLLGMPILGPIMAIVICGMGWGLQEAKYRQTVLHRVEEAAARTSPPGALERVRDRTFNYWGIGHLVLCWPAHKLLVRRQLVCVALFLIGPSVIAVALGAPPPPDYWTRNWMGGVALSLLLLFFGNLQNVSLTLYHTCLHLDAAEVAYSDVLCVHVRREWRGRIGIVIELVGRKRPVVLCVSTDAAHELADAMRQQGVRVERL